MSARSTGYTADSLVRDVLASPEGAALGQRYLASLINSPLFLQLSHVPIGQVIALDPLLSTDTATRERLLAELAAITEASAAPPRPVERAVTPSPDYEDASVARASAALSHPPTTSRWSVLEVVLDGPSHGNPFVDVALEARVTGPDGERRVPGFHDGGGTYRLRFLATEVGGFAFTTASNARSLDGLRGSFTVVDAAEGAHGPVRTDGFHFRHADGTRHVPLGTTAYAWTHQDEALEEATLATLAASPFTKVRMAVFPKSYLYNTDEPPRLPFERREDGSWDTTRFVPAFFAHLERRIADLASIGVQADLILFHPYDRWGFSDLGAAADDRFVRYVVARLAASANVWWSLANEHDLVRSKTTDDWERIAALVVADDPYDHLRSIHNCFTHYDHARPWVTHASTQRVDVYRTAEEVTAWRRAWGKPVVVDECAYEGDIDQGWGNVSGRELVRRCWEGAVRGGYVTHGETYLPAPGEPEVLWWSKGGVLRGESAPRIAFLREVLEEGPPSGLEPLPGEWDVPRAGVAGQWVLLYFGFMRPRFRSLVMPAGTRWSATVLDTWAMTREEVPGTFEGVFRIDLPGREHVALLLRAAADPAA